MARIFITGSSDGLGQAVARALISQGHQVTLHARNSQRAKDATAGAPGAEGILIADLSSIAETKRLAVEANKSGVFDTVIHNAGVGFREGPKTTEDGIAHTFAINTLAPYILTCLMTRPKKLMYMSSGMHFSGDGSLKDVTWTSGRRWNGSQAYSDSKLLDTILAFAVARHWPDVSSISITPGWVATKMGGSYAPDDLQQSIDSMSRLAVMDATKVGTGKMWASQKNGRTSVHAAVKDEHVQERLLEMCENISGVSFPRR